MGGAKTTVDSAAPHVTLICTRARTHSRIYVYWAKTGKLSDRKQNSVLTVY